MVRGSVLCLLLSLASCTQRGDILTLEPGPEDAADSLDGSGGAQDASGFPLEASIDAIDAFHLGLAVVLVDAQNPVHANDAVLEDRLKKIGFTVEERPYVDPVDAGEGIALVVLSSTLLTGGLDANLPDQPIPMVVLESFSYPRLGMTDMVQGGDFGAIDGMTIDVVAGPFALGPAGSVVVHMPASAINYGRPSSSAIVGAQLPGVNGAVSTFGYEARAMMFGRTAPARRVGVFLRTGTIASLTPEAWELFALAVRWAVQ
jgi:hypothetical protein